MRLVDTHCHLQVEAFEGRLDALLVAARAAGLENALLCAGARDDWEATARTAREHGLSYALGIHPLAVEAAADEDLEALEAAVKAALPDPAFAAVGEVGIDGLVPGAGTPRAEAVFAHALRLARRHDLPLSIHVRKSASRVLMYLRRLPPPGGVVHAFNGSDVERGAFLSLGLSLGFGGALTYSGSLRIRRHFLWLLEHAPDRWVFETDAPDMPGERRRASGSTVTEPADILDVLEAASALSGLAPETLAEVSRRNALRAFPRMAR